VEEDANCKTALCGSNPILCRGWGTGLVGRLT